MVDGEVIQLRTGPTGPAACLCGSAWFELRAQPGDPAPHGAVTFDANGRVAGFTGLPCCLVCGEPWRLPTTAW